MRRSPIQLDVTWIAISAATVAVLCMPADAASGGLFTRVVAWPAGVALSLVRQITGMALSNCLPLAIAGVVLVLGVAIDAARSLLRGSSPSHHRVEWSSHLGAWRLVSIICLVLVSVWYFIDRAGETVGVPGEEALIDAAQRRATAERALDAAPVNLQPSTLRVVVIGDSQSGCVFERSVDWNMEMSRRIERPVDLLQLAIPALTLQDMEQLMDRIFERLPDLILLQSSVLFEREFSAPRADPGRRARRWAGHFSAQAQTWLAGLGLRAPLRGPDRFGPADLPLDARMETVDLERLFDRWGRREARASDANLVLARDVIDRASSKGVTSAVFVLPVSDDLAAEAAGFLRNRDEILEDLAQQKDVEILRDRNSMPPRLFIDPVHVGSAGRDRVRSWLDPAIGELLLQRRAGFGNLGQEERVRMIDEFLPDYTTLDLHRRRLLITTIGRAGRVDLIPRLEELREEESNETLRATLDATIEELRKPDRGESRTP